MNELRKPQISILKALATYTTPLTRRQIAALSGVDQSKIGDYAGPRPDNQSEHTKLKWPFPTLSDLGLVTFDIVDTGKSEQFVYYLTRKGRDLIKDM